MISRKPQVAMLAIGVLALTALTALAGCGSGSSSSSSSDTSAGTGASTSSSSGSAGVVDVANNPKLGKILVDANGITLYYFEADKNGKSTCNGACAAVWPPYAGTPTAGSGADPSLLGTTKRSDGTTQVTYNNFPLYTYVRDSSAGDITGNNLEQFGAEWYALTPAGKKPAGT